MVDDVASLHIMQCTPDSCVELPLQLATVASTSTSVPSQYSIPVTYTMLSLVGIDSDNVSSLPSLVLRSMLKQRRILMRAH